MADFRAIPDPDRLRISKLFVAEGRLVVRRLLRESPLRARAVLVTPAAFASLEAELAAAPPDLEVFVADQPVLNAIGGFNFHRGCLALGERPPAGRDLGWLLGAARVQPRPEAVAPEDEAAAPAAAARRLVILEGVNNADNVGGIFRSAAALGADGVLLGPRCCDPLYRKAVRTGMGASLVLPFAHARDWPGDLAELRRRGFRVAALTPGENARTIEDAVGLRNEPLLAILAGEEGEGLTAEALAAADEHLRIPMVTGVDSLNVTIAVSIALDRFCGAGRR